MVCKLTKNFTFETMKMRLGFSIFISLLFSSNSVLLAQVKTPVNPFESKQGYLFDMSFTVHKPLGDMADRFGYNSALGLGANYKTKNNWQFGAQYQWLFGQSVRQTNMLDSIAGPSGQILDNQGNVAVIRFFERGHNGYLQASKLIPLGVNNRNSGLFFQTGVGFMLHRVYIYSSTTTVPQLSDDYKKGYDRMSGGLALKQFIGYQHLDPKKRINIIVGFEFQQGFTKSLRSFDYDTRTVDVQKRKDLLIGPKIGLILPFYTKKKSDEEFFTD
jgi:hypothetical protein